MKHHHWWCQVVNPCDCLNSGGRRSSMRFRSRVAGAMLASMFLVGVLPTATVLALPNPVATNDAEYAAFGRVFSDPQGCRVKDVDGDGVNDVVPPATSPWAKGN